MRPTSASRGLAVPSPAGRPDNTARWLATWRSGAWRISGAQIGREECAVASVAWGQASSARRLRTGERLKMLPKRGDFAPFREDALQWNQALESVQAGRIHPVLLTFSESRNCSQSDYPARGDADDSAGGQEAAQRHENKGEDSSLHDVNGGQGAYESWVIGYPLVNARKQLIPQMRGTGFRFAYCPTR